MPDTTPTTPAPFRYIDGDDFCLSARLLPDLNNGGTTGTLSMTIEGSDEPQSAHVPVTDLPQVLAGIAAAAGLPARLVLGTTDQQPDTIGLCGYCGIPRETHHHGYVSTDTVNAAAPHRVTADAPVDRSGVLREAADALDNSERLRNLTDDHMRDINAASDELRRMADEAQQPETEAGGPCPHCRHISCRDRTPCNAILSATSITLQRCPCTGAPAADQPDTETEAAKPEPAPTDDRCPGFCIPCMTDESHHPAP